MNGLKHLQENQQRDALEHDKAVSILSAATVIAAAKDLMGRCAHNRKDPEQRWTMERKAALRREIVRRNLTSADA